MMTNLHNTFIENNIHFRIISSKLLERYKSTQSFVLTEMIHGQFKFSKTSREISLLKMDIWFQWVNDLEQFLIRDKKNEFNISAVRYALASADIVNRYYMAIVTERSDIFDPRIVTIWADVHDDLYDAFTDTISACEGMSDIDAFASISNFLVELMETLKFELYEIDYLCNGGKKPFLCMTDLCLIYARQSGKTLLPGRAKKYVEFFNIPNSFEFKNYSQEMSPVQCVNSLRDAGVEITNNTDLELGGISL